MALLTFTEARHFSRGFDANSVNNSSFRAFAYSLALNRSFSEGTTAFDEYRNGALREIERLLFLGASHYRRAFDLQMASSSAWAHVTLYYGALFSAQAMLGAVGSWKLKKRHFVDVEDGTPGSQVFIARNTSTTYSGSHQMFWDYFYSAVAPLAPLLDPSLRFAITPINGDPTWQTDQRNSVNYDSFEALQLAGAFQQFFKETQLRKTLPGALNTQFRVTEALLLMAVHVAREVRINTDALASLTPPGKRRAKINQLISTASLPRAERHIRKLALR